MIDEKPPIGAEEVAEATVILQKYKAGKAALDKRIVDNELWFRMGHWKNYHISQSKKKKSKSQGDKQMGLGGVKAIMLCK